MKLGVLKFYLVLLILKLGLFLIFADFEPQYSFEIVLIKKRVYHKSPTSVTFGVRDRSERHILSARVPPIPNDRSHKNPVVRRQGNYLLVLFFTN